jgi:hypothetical protein
MVHAPAFQSLPLVFQLELLAYLAQVCIAECNLADIAAFSAQITWFKIYRHFFFPSAGCVSRLLALISFV